jgi:hypothetical protein
MPNACWRWRARSQLLQRRDRFPSHRSTLPVPVGDRWAAGEPVERGGRRTGEHLRRYARRRLGGAAPTRGDHRPGRCPGGSAFVVGGRDRRAPVGEAAIAADHDDGRRALISGMPARGFTPARAWGPRVRRAFCRARRRRRTRMACRRWVASGTEARRAGDRPVRSSAGSPRLGGGVSGPPLRPTAQAGPSPRARSSAMTGILRDVRFGYSPKSGRRSTCRA